MELTSNGLINKEAWLEKDYDVYAYNREEIIANTKQYPQWIHFGAGNIFRAFPAHLAQRLLNNNEMRTGIVVAEGYDMEILDVAYTPFDNLSILATLKSDGKIRKTIIGSVVESLKLLQKHEDFKRLQAIFQEPSLQMATFTITEKGYQLYDRQKLPYPNIQNDFALGPNHVESYIGMITALLYARYLAGAYPLAMVSLDNCSHNGEKLFLATKEFAHAWSEYNLVEKGFYDYITNEQVISFPCTMIDKITPRPSNVVIDALAKDGITNIKPIKTKKGTYVAPFVNAEEAEYLVIEDRFPNGRPCLEKVGVRFCGIAVVDQVERMKVCTCLNPLHTALAIFGCLFQYETIYACMQDPLLKQYIEGIGYDEGLPVVTDPKIIHPRTFLNEVINQRLLNPFMPDTPQRIATDTSLKLGIRFGETIKEYNKHFKLHVSSLMLIPFVLAGWCRYLLGIDDEGNAFTCSDDPNLAWAQECLKEVVIGEKIDAHKILQPILSNQQIFQVDLYELGLAKQIETYFSNMSVGKHAVKESLKNLLKK